MLNERRFFELQRRQDPRRNEQYSKTVRQHVTPKHMRQSDRLTDMICDRH